MSQKQCPSNSQCPRNSLCPRNATECGECHPLTLPLCLSVCFNPIQPIQEKGEWHDITEKRSNGGWEVDFSPPTKTRGRTTTQTKSSINQQLFLWLHYLRIPYHTETPPLGYSYNYFFSLLLIHLFLPFFSRFVICFFSMEKQIGLFLQVFHDFGGAIGAPTQRDQNAANFIWPNVAFKVWEKVQHHRLFLFFAAEGRQHRAPPKTCSHFFYIYYKV